MKKKVSLVLSGGGARGLAHLGFIHELERRGYEIVAISGTSIGAMVAGVYASGKLNELEAFLTQLTIDDVVHYIDLTLKDSGLIKGVRVFDRMKEFWPDCNIEDLPIPVSIVATDLISGKEKVFRTGSLYKAIRASIAIPLVFTPQHRQNEVLVDGGLSNLIPFSQVARPQGAILAAVNLYGPTDLNIDLAPRVSPKHESTSSGIWSKISERWDKMKDWKVALYRSLISQDSDKHNGYVLTLRRSTTLMMQSIARLSIQLHQPQILIEIPENCAGALDFHYGKSLIELGENLGRKAIDQYENERRGLKGFIRKTSRFFGAKSRRH